MYKEMAVALFYVLFWNSCGATKEYLSQDNRVPGTDYIVPGQEEDIHISHSRANLDEIIAESDGTWIYTYWDWLLTDTLA